jgi:hypothetical protein
MTEDVKDRMTVDMAPLTEDEVLRCLREIVAWYGPDWRDPNAGGERTCQYVYDDRLIVRPANVDTGRRVAEVITLRDLKDFGGFNSSSRERENVAMLFRVAWRNSPERRVRCVIGELLWRLRGIQIRADDKSCLNLLQSGVIQVEPPSAPEGEGEDVEYTINLEGILSELQRGQDAGTRWGELLHAMADGEVGL